MKGRLIVMKMVIVTGMSGAGKSTALNVLEDEGYYCVDNMPISLVVKFAELAAGQEEGYSDIALGIDIRSGNALGEFDEVLDELSRRHYRYKILYLDSSDEVLVKRYKETRRTHPLAKDDRVDKGIARERKKLEFLKKRADYIIDTSQLLTREFKQELEKIFISAAECASAPVRRTLCASATASAMEKRKKTQRRCEKTTKLKEKRI